jgi:predicted signal transduction protein with EAL and GGDEF domain
VLQELSQRLRAAVREDQTVGRFGADEFLVVLSEPEDTEEVVRIAQQIIRAVSEPLDLDGKPLQLSCSIGIGVYPEDGGSGEALIRNADTAMYRAKQSGRGGWQLHSPALNTRTRERLALEQELVHALEHGEQIGIHLQPVVRLADRRTVGAEAQVRWHHPERGLLYPVTFEPLAERAGLAGALEERTLDRVAGQLLSWRREGVPLLPITLRLSGAGLAQTSLIPTLRRLLQAGELDPVLIRFAITERTLLGGGEHAEEQLEAIRAFGCGVIIEEFGSGHSSLELLSARPVTGLKIGRRLVHELAQAPRAPAVVAAVIELARVLELEVIAKGIETGDDLERLRELGCTLGQGRLLGSPQPPEEFLTTNFATEPHA